MNSTQLVGRVATAPNLRTTPQGTSVLDLRLAVDRRGEGADFINVTAWGKTATACGEYLDTGRRVAVTGRLEQQQWTDRDTGTNRERLVVVANSVDFLDAPKG